MSEKAARLLAMKQYAQGTGQPLSDWRTQASFALQELRSRPEGPAVANATTPEQLALGQMYFERPQGFTTDDPTAGHNYTGRLNTLRAFTPLNPNATGAFAPSANPQVQPAQPSGSLPGGGAGAASGGSPLPAAGGPNPFGSIGDPTLNAALAKILAQSRPAGQQPLVNQLLSPITQPLHQALAGGSQALHGGIASLLGGGNTANSGASLSPSPSTPAPSTTPPVDPAAAPDGALDPNNLPVPPQRPAAAPALAATSSPPTFAQPGVLSALSSLLGAGQG